MPFHVLLNASNVGNFSLMLSLKNFEKLKQKIFMLYQTGMTLDCICLLLADVFVYVSCVVDGLDCLLAANRRLRVCETVVRGRRVL